MGRQEDTDELAGSSFIALTEEQAKRFRQSNAVLSPWWIVFGQIVMGSLVALLALAMTNESAMAVSAVCGSLAVIVPAALFARGLMGRFATLNPTNAVTSFFVWELVKIGLTVAVLLMAHRWVDDLSWLAMLIGLAVTTKVYWLALLVNGKRMLVKD